MAGTRRGAAVGLVVACALLTAPARADDSAPASFDLTATAVGLAVQSTQRPASSIVTAGLVDATVAFSSSSLSSYGSSETRAAAAYPGDLVAGGPALLCANVFPCPVTPPDYPLLADAVYPTRPSAMAPAAAPVGTAVATAGPRSTAGAASTGERREPAPVSIQVGAASVSTHLWVDGSGGHALSTSVLKDVSIGPLGIAVLQAVDAVDVSATGIVRDHPRLTLSGVTLAGQAASVDERGVHVAGQDARVPNETLAAQGISARLLSTSQQDAKGVARSAAAGLLLTFSVPVSGVPQVPNAPSFNRDYLGSVLVGGAGAVVAAADLPALDLPALPPAPAGSATSAVLPGTGPRPASLGQGTPAQAPVDIAPRDDRATSRVASWLPLSDLSTVALLLMVVPLALLTLWRGTVRLTRRTS
jgi:hypothetical protein